jgi:transposase
MRGLKRYFSPATKLEVVKRYLADERVADLAVAYAIRPTLVHQWVKLYRRLGEGGLRDPGRPRVEARVEALLSVAPPDRADDGAAARQRIALLERKIAQQALELDFFKHALRHFETPLQPVERPGATAPTPSSGRKRSRKAD